MTDEISLYLQRLQEGRDEEACQELWNTYFSKLVNVAKRNLAMFPNRDQDEEDVALSAMQSFFTSAEQGRFENLSNRDELWKLLVTLVIRKANRHKERANAQKRGGGNVRGESVFLNANDLNNPGLAGFPDERLVADLMSECSELLNRLDDETLKQIALLKLEGYTYDEISAELDISRSGVKRKIARIKELWSEFGAIG